MYYIDEVTEAKEKNMDIKDIAKEIRAVLKGAFPATKFSVKSSRFSQGSSVDTSWTDGPTTEQVDDLIGEYGDTRSRFIETNRTHSRELVNQGIKLWKEQNPECAHFTVTCKGEASCHAEFDISEFSDRSCFELQDCERSLINDVIYGLAFDGVNFIFSQEDEDDCKPKTVSAPEPELVEALIKTTLQVQPSQPDALEADALEAERKQAYTQYIASWQEADVLEAKLTAKRKESKELGEKLEEIKAKIESKRLEKVRATRPPKVNEITLTRTEGPNSECREPVTVKVKTFAAADKVLRQWARTAPDDGAYDKCDIILNLASGNIHKTRFDLMRSHVFGSQLHQQLEKQFNTKLSSSDASIWCGW